MLEKVFLDICIGDLELHNTETSKYEAAEALLSKYSTMYGLPDSLVALSLEQQELLQDVDVYIP